MKITLTNYFLLLSSTLISLANCELSVSDITSKVVGTTAVFNISNKELSIEKLSLDQWVNCIAKTEGNLIVSSTNSIFYISILRLNKGCVVIHLRAFKGDPDYSVFYHLYDNQEYLNTNIGEQGTVNFHQLLLNDKLISEGFLLRFDKNKYPTKARLEFRIKGGGEIITELDIPKYSS